jgi:hypothetical protein
MTAKAAAAGTLNKRNSPVGQTARIAQTSSVQGFVYHVNNAPKARDELEQAHDGMALALSYRRSDVQG